MAAVKALLWRRARRRGHLAQKPFGHLFVGGCLCLIGGLQILGPDLARGQEAPLRIKLPEIVVVVEGEETLGGERIPTSPPEVLTGVELSSITPQSVPRRRADRVYSLSEKSPPVIPRPLDCFGSSFLSGAAKSSQGAPAFYHRGIFLFLEGNLEEARAEFEDGLKQEVTTDVAARLRYWQGEARFQLGDLDGAVQAWQEVTSDGLLPFSGDALYSLGWVAFSQKDYAEALQLLERLLNRYPSHGLRTQALFLAGESALEVGRPNRANMHLQEAVDLAPDSFEGFHASYRLGEILLDSERYREAVDAYRKHLGRSDAETPHLGPSRKGLAWSLFSAGEYEASAEAFSEYIRGEAAGADVLEARFGRLVSLLETGNKAEAEAELRSLQEADPKNPWSLRAGLFLGARLFREQDYRGAAATVQATLSQAPEGIGERERDVARVLLSASLYGAGDYEASAHIFQGASQEEGFPGAEDAAFWLIWARLQLGDADGAAKAADEFQARFPSSQRLEEVTFWKGEALLRLDRYEAARSALEQVPASHPRHAEATLGLGWTYFGEGKWLDAREAFRRAASLSARAPALLGQAVFHEGESSFNLKDYDAAIGAYEILIQDVPEHPLADEATFRLGIFHYRKGEFEEAADAFATFLARPTKPAPDRGHYWLGLSRLRARQYSLARISFQRLARDFPGSLLREDALLRIGHAYYNEGRIDEAIRAYRNLLDETPGEERGREARYGIALTRLRGGDISGFVGEARGFIAVNQDHPLAVTLEFQLAEHFLSQQQYEEAGESYGRVLAHQAGQELADSAQFRIGEIESLMGRHPHAAVLFRELIAQFPESRLRGDARLRLAQALSASGDCQGALDEFRLFLRAFPRHGLFVRALFDAGTCARRLGDEEAARDFFSTLVGKGPSGILTAQSHWELAQMAKARGELQIAIQHMEKALKGGGRELRPRAQFALGEILESLKEPRQAIVEYLKVVYLYPGQSVLNDRALIRIGEIYEKLGESNPAIKIYQKLKTESKDPAVRQQAQERIGILEGESHPAGGENSP